MKYLRNKALRTDWINAVESLVYDPEYGEPELHDVDWSEFPDWVIMRKNTENLCSPEEKVYWEYAGTECRKYYRAYGDAWLTINRHYVETKEVSVYNTMMNSILDDVKLMCEAEQKHGLISAYDTYMFTSALEFCHYRRISKENQQLRA